MLIVAGVLFVVQQIVGPLQFTLAQTLAWRIEDQLRERAALASFGPVGVAALEEPETFDTLADLSDVSRGTGFGPGWSVWATLLLGGVYLQWAVYAWWAALALAAGLARAAARDDPYRLRAAQPLRGELRGGAAAARLLPRPHHVGQRRQGDSRLRAALVAHEPLPRARRRGASARMAVAAAEHLRLVPARVARLDCALGIRDRRRRTRGGARNALAGHRFSTVRMADTIVVVEDGGVAEAGTHDELIANNGTYAELFALQAAAYG